MDAHPLADGAQPAPDPKPDLEGRDAGPSRRGERGTAAAAAGRAPGRGGGTPARGGEAPPRGRTAAPDLLYYIFCGPHAVDEEGNTGRQRQGDEGHEGRLGHGRHVQDEGCEFWLWDFFLFARG